MLALSLPALTPTDLGLPLVASLLKRCPVLLLTRLNRCHPKELGLDVPAMLFARADEVIE